MAIEDEDEKPSHISSAVSLGEKQADLSSREILNDGNETFFDVNTSLVSASSSSDGIPDPSLSLGTNGGVCPQFIQDLNSNAPDLSDNINNAIVINSTYLRALQGLNQNDPGELCYLLGIFDACTPMISCIISTLRSGGDFKAVAAYIGNFAEVLVPNMEIFADVKMRMEQRAALIMERADAIPAVDMRGPVSSVAKAFAAKEEKTGTNNEGGDEAIELTRRELAALAAYNNHTGKDECRLPDRCAVVHQKVKNHSASLVSFVMAVRVTSSIKLSEVDSRYKRPGVGRKRNLKLIFTLARAVQPDLSGASILDMTIYQYLVGILFPILNLSIDKLFEPVSISTDEYQPLLTIFVQLTTFLKEEMIAKPYIDRFKRAGSVSMIDNMDGLHPDEIQRRSDEIANEDCYFCKTDKRGKVLTYTRKPCAAILFSLLNAMLLGKTLIPFGLQQDTIDAFVFGLLCNAPSNYSRVQGEAKTIPLAFLFDEENYSQDMDIENAEVLVVDNIKPVIDTAIDSMKEFETEAHFAEKEDVTAFKKYLEAFIQTVHNS